MQHESQESEDYADDFHEIMEDLAKDQADHESDRDDDPALEDTQIDANLQFIEQSLKAAEEEQHSHTVNPQDFRP